MQGVKTYDSTDLTTGYWQLTMHGNSQTLHTFITSDGVMQPTGTAQGGSNSAVSTQVCFKTYSDELQDHILFWMDDFVIHHSSEPDLLGLLAHLVQIFSVSVSLSRYLSLPSSLHK